MCGGVASSGRVYGNFWPGTLLEYCPGKSTLPHSFSLHMLILPYADVTALYCSPHDANVSRMYYDPTIVAVTRIPDCYIVRIGRLNYKVHLEEGMISDGTSVTHVRSERAVVEEASVNKYQYACSSVDNNCIKY